MATVMGRYALSLGVAALIAGCAGWQPPVDAPGAVGRSAGMMRWAAPASAYEMLYHFRAGRGDGVQPHARLIDVNGTLYGTTFAGGAYNGGTFYSLTTTGSEKVLYNFGKGSDAVHPVAGLINVNGTLYGTAAGGAHRSGTVYSITTAGAEKVLYNFEGHISGPSGDGAVPVAPLVNVKGTLYGTTHYGGSVGCGSHTCGTIFSVSTTGKERVLYKFAGGSDGAEPMAGLIDLNGTLYGTTTEGGGVGSQGVCCGTVFSVTAAGKEQLLYRFGGGSDGAYPQAGLIDVNGTLYGTTVYGGDTSGCNSVNGTCGTVFAVTTAGQEKVLYRFAGGPDGAEPSAGLIELKGTLYGTTAYGGGSRFCNGGSGCGTLFSITTGTERVVHAFAGGDADGANPLADLVDVKGTLYGTTVYGGPKCGHHGGLRGCGTVFALTP